jgi:hypothetical protein
MKLYGYAETDPLQEQVVPAALAEITLCATSSELRKMAIFLEYCAAEMEKMGATYDHVHLSDRLKEFATSPHFVVASMTAIET